MYLGLRLANTFLTPVLLPVSALRQHLQIMSIMGCCFAFFVWNEVAPFDAQNLSEASGVKGVSSLSWLVFRQQISQPHRSVESTSEL